MRTKKSEQANLERYRGLVRQMGIILALGFVFIAFEYTNADIATPNLDFGTEVFIEPDYVPITKEPTLPPPPPPPLYVFNEIIVVDNDIELPPDIELVNVDIEDGATIFVDNTPEEIDTDAIFIHVEDDPEFPGGTTALMKYLGQNVRYPAICQEMGIQGRVYVSFVVNRDGSIVDVEIMKGVDSNLDEEALRVIRAMPNWKPGVQSGRKVRVSYRIPISFSLR